MGKRNFSTEEKQEYCLAFERSGMKQGEFCRTIGVSASALRKWYREFKQNTINANFTPVVIKKTVDERKKEIQIAIHLPNQVKLCLTMDEHRLVSFIQELGNAAAIIR